MTTAAVALRSAWVRVSVRPDVLGLAGVAAFTGLLATATWGTWGDLDSDTGYDVVAGARVAEGELPYRDFVYYYGPLAPALAGLGALVGGPGFGPAIALGFVVALAIVAATYALARIVVGPLGAFLASAITAAVAFIPSNYSFVLPHTFAATLGTLFLLLALLALWRYGVDERDSWALAAGLAVGLATLTKPEPALASLLAVAAWLVLRRASGLRVGRPALLVGAPALGIPALVYGSFLLAVSPRTLVLKNLWPVDELAAGGSVLVRARMPLTAESALELVRISLPYAAGIAGLVVLGRLLDRGGRLRRPLLAALGVTAALVVAVCIVKPDGLRDGLYYAYRWVPLGAVVAVVALLIRSRRGGATPARHVELAGAVALLALSATVYHGFSVHGWRPSMAHYYVPLAAILLVGLHLRVLGRTRTTYVLGAAWVAFLALAGTGLALKDAREESATVRGPGGALAETPEEASLYNAALAEIAARTEPGEPILVAPMMTGLLPLSGHESPLPKLSMLPGALPSEADQRDAIARLDRAGVRVILTDHREWKGYGHGVFGETFDRTLAAWLERNFDLAATLRSGGERPRAVDVWVRG